MGKDWDAKYREGGAGQEPSELLVRMASHLPQSGRALDVAAGAGRNAVFLAERGMEVDAVDSSAEGLRQAEALAAQRGVSIRTVLADLTAFDLGTDRYDLIVNINYLQRDLAPRIARALGPGGVVFFETYVRAQANRSNGPSNPDYLLRPGELESLFAGMEIIHAVESDAHGRAVASLIARRRSAG